MSNSFPIFTPSSSSSSSLNGNTFTTLIGNALTAYSVSGATVSAAQLILEGSVVSSSTITSTSLNNVTGTFLSLTGSNLASNFITGSSASISSISGSLISASLFTGANALISSISGALISATSYTGSTASFTTLIASTISGATANINTVSGALVSSTAYTGNSASFSTLIASTISGSNALLTSISGGLVTATSYTGASASFSTLASSSITANTLTTTGATTLCTTNGAFGTKNSNLDDGNGNMFIGGQQLYIGVRNLYNGAVNAYLNMTGVGGYGLGYLTIRCSNTNVGVCPTVFPYTNNSGYVSPLIVSPLANISQTGATSVYGRCSTTNVAYFDGNMTTNGIINTNSLVSSGTLTAAVFSGSTGTFSYVTGGSGSWNNLFASNALFTSVSGALVSSTAYTGANASFGNLIASNISGTAGSFQSVAISTSTLSNTSTAAIALSLPQTACPIANGNVAYILTSGGPAIPVLTLSYQLGTTFSVLSSANIQCNQTSNNNTAFEIEYIQPGTLPANTQATISLGAYTPTGVSIIGGTTSYVYNASTSAQSCTCINKIIYKFTATAPNPNFLMQPATTGFTTLAPGLITVRQIT